MITMFIVMLSTLTVIFMCLNHPISMGITIIVQTLVISMITGMMLGSFWFSYIIMITMLSGMLVLFIYMASVASNEKFFSSLKLIFFTIYFLIVALVSEWNTEYIYNEMNKILSMLSTEDISLTILFNMKNKMLTLLMILYLFLTMITVSLIVNISEGPLRVSKK